MIDLDEYHKSIDDKVRQINDVILSGNCSTLENYREKCGERKGLLAAKLKMKDVLTKQEDE